MRALSNSKDPILIMLLIVAAFLIFANLDNIYLWADEAETAVIARNTLIYGFPRGYDERNTVWGTGGFGPNYIWIYHTWLQFYLVAFSFLVFGINTFAARLPFAVLGFFSIFLTYRLSWCLFKDKNISRISTLFLVFSIPFLLHLRQCRYYSLTVFTVLLVLLSYLQFVENKRLAALKLVISFILLFHSNHGTFIPVFIALFLHYIVFHSRSKDLKKLLIVCALIFLFTLPWMFLLKSWHHGKGGFTFEHLQNQFEFYCMTINKYVFPMAFFSVTAAIYLAIKRRLPALPRHINRSKFWLVIFTIVVSISFLCVVDQRHFRYIVQLIPLLFIVEALILSRWFKINKYLATIVTLILLFSNFFNSPHLKIPLLNYLYEITHDYDGPNEGIVKFLCENANPTDTVKIQWGDRSVIFYTNLFVDSRPFFEYETYPEWIVFRRDWISKEDLKEKYFQKIEKQYQKIAIDYPDIYWGNRPEPGYHKFRTVSNVPKVIIYKRNK